MNNLGGVVCEDASHQTKVLSPHSKCPFQNRSELLTYKYAFPSRQGNLVQLLKLETLQFEFVPPSSLACCWMYQGGGCVSCQRGEGVTAASKLSPLDDPSVVKKIKNKKSKKKSNNQQMKNKKM